LTGLEELYLVNNKITVIQGLDKLTNLKLLEYVRTRRGKFTGVCVCLCTRETGEGGVGMGEKWVFWLEVCVFDPWTSRLFRYGSNRIRTIENLEPLVNLEELWLGSSPSPLISSVLPLLSSSPSTLSSIFAT
jgi:protein phosphatase 1 regulatory subunit 7